LGWLALPVLVGAFQIAGTMGAWQRSQNPRYHGPGPGPEAWGDPSLISRPDALAFALLVIGPLALYARNRWPLPVLGIAGGAVLAFSLLGYPRGPIFLSLIIAYFVAVVRGHRLAAAVAGVAGMLIYAGLAALPGGVPPPGLVDVAFQVGWGLALLSIAELVRVRRERLAEAARVHEEERRRQAGEERLRIARELHDVLAHNISMINVQAGVALHLMDDNPEQARTALAAIKDASKEALTEVRSVLGVLRRVDEEAPRAPTAGLARLGDLIARAEAAGITVRRRVSGTARTLPSGVDRAAFRIVQEALTNVARHARARTATIRIDYGADHVTVGVDDDGIGAGSRQRHAQPAEADSPGTGSGITGMRERTSALGGELYAGPAPAGGFRVRARLPLPPDATHEPAPASARAPAAGPAPTPGPVSQPGPASSRPAGPAQEG
jgi:signal transduction histidine kinase